MLKPLITYYALIAAGYVIVTTILALAPFATTLANQGLSTDKESFVERMSSQHGFDAEEMRDLLAQARHDDRALKRIKSPAEALEWHRYRQIFLTRERITAGAKYWQEHEKIIDDVVDKFGVEAHILIAILGVESYYGERSGDHRVLDALSTLAFQYPPRSSFFRNELEAFLLLAKQHGLDPTEIYGSYAGAMGKPQFISSSYKHYAVAADGDGQADLFNNVADAMASVANYLNKHGWQHNGQITNRTEADGSEWEKALASLNRPVRSEYTAEQLTNLGVKIPQDAAGSDRLGLIKLEAEDGPELWLTHTNFYVLTRYNHSALYAMAVYQLAEAILEEHKR
ncbi:membrane-bound lytic murein transglycosylase B precursor [Halorhodospira halochloris]|uniref:Membrane-bound lytic murein transglycosylase B n=1 Tax=Halorhodospira halochloris TaxID=1052 RepID=A0A0X8X6E5_HALHR|nr:lytic murein transglycosylase B [Halorhodospira halochloris]MBK1650993.1 lytic murein transglycosylase B [Halorhodospira halochloris]BAU56497.1 membrane-bound lytic murein transglycosylase B precursor [Halorhodospira halochloris]